MPHQRRWNSEPLDAVENRREQLALHRSRRQLGLSAAEFARRLGVSAASVYRWEATMGRLKLQARPLAALAKLQQRARMKSAPSVTN